MIILGILIWAIFTGHPWIALLAWVHVMLAIASAHRRYRERKQMIEAAEALHNIFKQAQARRVAHNDEENKVA